MKSHPRKRDKESIRRWARKVGRKVLWKDAQGNWYAASDWYSTPRWAVDSEEV